MSFLLGDFYDDSEWLLLEATNEVVTTIIKDRLYPKISEVLSTPSGDRKFKQLVGQYMDKHSETLHMAGPMKLIPFGDTDKAQYFQLFQITDKEVKEMIVEMTRKITMNSDFKLLTNNPIFSVFYCCIRYYTLKKDEKGLNTSLAIYALSNYPSIFSMSFPHEPNPGVMQYTMDNLSEKYILKQGGSLFGGLFLSIKHSYAFLKDYMKDGSDKEVIRFIQRIRNDQKSIMKNICDQYMKNHAKGLRVKLSKDSYDEVQVDVDAENNTTIVETITNNIVNQIITNNLDLRRVTSCKDIAGISLTDCRFYLSKIVSVKYTSEIHDFVQAVLFLYLYDEHHSREDINSTHFLNWSAELFRKTNSNNKNISTIKKTLDKWGEETGVHSKFKREASRINYKRAIFWYFILSIQYFNKI